MKKTIVITGSEEDLFNIDLLITQLGMNVEILDSSEVTMVLLRSKSNDKINEYIIRRK